MASRGIRHMHGIQIYIQAKYSNIKLKWNNFWYWRYSLVGKLGIYEDPELIPSIVKRREKKGNLFSSLMVKKASWIFGLTIILFYNKTHWVIYNNRDLFLTILQIVWSRCPYVVQRRDKRKSKVCPSHIYTHAAESLTESCSPKGSSDKNHYSNRPSRQADKYKNFQSGNELKWTHPSWGLILPSLLLSGSKSWYRKGESPVDKEFVLQGCLNHQNSS